MFDFDTVIDRRGTNSLKYDFAKERGKAEDVLPLWVADMDFKTAPAILDKLEQVVRHGIFGYTESKEDYFRALEGWYRERFGWKVQKSWLIKTPGVVFALAAAVRAFTDKGDAVLIQQPVYYPFMSVIEKSGRKLANNALRQVDGHYEIDFADFEQKVVQDKVKLFILCSPHNPVGRVWKEWELRKLGDICLEHGVVIVSDEIHSDFVWQGHKHLVLSSLSPEYEKITVTCTAPSKTFNLAGLQISNIFVPDAGLRKKLHREVLLTGYSEASTVGLAACQAAYESGGEWLEELKNYIWENYLFLEDYLARNIPQIHPNVLEGTYLVWLDCRGLGMTEAEREDFIVKKAKLWLDKGTMFGTEGEGFERINIACPRKTLEKALGSLRDALRQEGAL